MIEKKKQNLNKRTNNNKLSIITIEKKKTVKPIYQFFCFFAFDNSDCLSHCYQMC